MIIGREEKEREGEDGSEGGSEGTKRDHLLPSQLQLGSGGRILVGWYYSKMRLTHVSFDPLRS